MRTDCVYSVHYIQYSTRKSNNKNINHKLNTMNVIYFRIGDVMLGLPLKWLEHFISLLLFRNGAWKSSSLLNHLQAFNWFFFFCCSIVRMETKTRNQINSNLVWFVQAFCGFFLHPNKWNKIKQIDFVSFSFQNTWWSNKLKVLSVFRKTTHCWKELICGVIRVWPTHYRTLFFFFRKLKVSYFTWAWRQEKEHFTVHWCVWCISIINGGVTVACNIPYSFRIGMCIVCKLVYWLKWGLFNGHLIKFSINKL